MTTAEKIYRIIGKEPLPAFAARADISLATLYRFLNGAQPNGRSARKIAKAGGVSVDWIWGDSAQVEEPPGYLSDARLRKLEQDFRELLVTGDPDTLALFELALKTLGPAKNGRARVKSKRRRR